VRTVPIERRPNKVAAAEFASPPPADRRDRSFSLFLKSLPDVLVARDFLRVVNAIASAAKSKKAVVVMLGGHIVKTGLAAPAAKGFDSSLYCSRNKEDEIRLVLIGRRFQDTPCRQAGPGAH